MTERTRIGATFGKAAPDYDAHAQLQRVVREECISYAASCWQPHSRLLDLGCGTGQFSAETRQRGLDWDITQCDLSEGMCRTASWHNPEVVVTHAGALPFATGSFDGIFSSLMLQWVAEPLAAFREMARVLRPGGTAVVSTLLEGTLEELRQSFTVLDHAEHVNRFTTPAALTALNVHAGFKLLMCEQETITIHYPDVLSLLRSIKAIGASHVTGMRRSGMMTPRQLAKLEAEYAARFAGKRKKKGLPATWQVLYMVMETKVSPQ